MSYRESPFGSEAREKLEGQGFFLPPKPKHRVSIPEDLTEVDSEELMDLFSAFTAWADYAFAQVGLAYIAEREAQREVDAAEATAWTKVPAKTPVAAGKGYVASIPDVQEAQDKFDEAWAYRRLVTDMAERFERDASLLSRELTRRTSETRIASRRERMSP